MDTRPQCSVVLIREIPFHIIDADLHTAHGSSQFQNQTAAGFRIDQIHASEVPIGEDDQSIRIDCGNRLSIQV